MSMFERPPESSQLFSAPELRRRSWPKIISAFAAGVACTFLIVTFSRESAPPLGELAKSAKVAQRTEPSRIGEPKTSPPVADGATAQPGQSGLPSPSPSPSRTAGVPSEDAPASAGSTSVPGNSVAAQSQASRCDRQAWPHMSPDCIGGEASSNDTAGAATATDAQRAVRVIPTDRRVSTDRNAGRATSSRKPPAEPTRDTAANGSASEADVGRVQPLRTTDGSAPGREASRDLAGAPEEQARIGDRGAGSSPPPLPAPKPKALARGADPAQTTQDKPSPAMDRADANQQDAATESRSWSEPRTRELRQSQRRAKANERQARRSGDRPDKRRSVRAQEAADIETPTAAFEDETGWVRDETRRPAREAPVRGVRKRSDPADDDDEGYTIVRSHRSRDGRQVTVYEVPRRERQTETRTVIREEPARPRAPFLFDLFNIGGPAD